MEKSGNMEKRATKNGFPPVVPPFPCPDDSFATIPHFFPHFMSQDEKTWWDSFIQNPTMDQFNLFPLLADDVLTNWSHFSISPTSFIDPNHEDTFLGTDATRFLQTIPSSLKITKSTQYTVRFFSPSDDANWKSAKWKLMASNVKGHDGSAFHESIILAGFFLKQNGQLSVHTCRQIESLLHHS